MGFYVRSVAVESGVHSQLPPDFEVAFEMCRGARHHCFTLVIGVTIGRGLATVHPFIKYLIGLIKPFLEPSLFVFLNLVLTHVISPLRPLRAG
jgi:hypothetical protein